MARRGGGEGGGMAAPLIGVAISLLIFVILEIFAPTIAGTIEEGQPDLGVTSEWNKTYNTDLPTGADTWTTVVRIIGAVFLVIVVTIAFFYLKGMT